ncbi:methyltransferase domain-containing protein [Ancylobacter sonchi]|uniref:class I SAM-dependent methyltransferase n=1 Tax=Ancylobacter sonchi TaxID=1937790 RepID=UPI001BD3209A|nr:methyltransferase domain-containing protein [Ancylobacter sonchi]MBS7532641.1 methyltransferase domain-containing protein [Ancylobacter sonchi]
MTGYALDNSWAKAERRLSLLEQHLDPMTQRRLAALGVAGGAHCLEIGAGGGSVARWLADCVGQTGRVVATDINISLLKGLAADNVETIVHDILAGGPPGGPFDFVHARWLLHHLPDPEQAIRNMISVLRPGGWLMLEEVDFFPVHASDSETYTRFMVALTDNVVRASGRDCFWARALPAMVARQGLRSVAGEGDFSIIQGGSPTAEFFILTAEQMRERMVASGEITEARLDEAVGLLSSPDFWAFGGGGVAIWGQRTD